MIKLCFLAPSGYGKSTAIDLLSKHFNLTNIKIAAPLYEMQETFYNKIEIPIKNTQDGELLQFLGMKIRKENPNYLLNEFYKNCINIKDIDILTNDDCRPMDYEYLKKMGFIFIKIEGYSHERADHTPIDKKNNLEWKNEIPCDFIVENKGSIEEYENNLLELIDNITNMITKCYIFPTVNICNCDCKFCISKTRDFSKFPTFLKPDSEFRKNIELLSKRSIKRFEITGGGEPFLNKQLQGIVDIIKEIIPDSYIKLYTNGNILKIINNIDELDLSIAHFDKKINDSIMQPKTISTELLDKLKFYKNMNCKIRLSLVVSKIGIKNADELNTLITLTDDYVDEYVVRTIYNGTQNIDDMYVDFNYEHKKVIWERDNTGLAKNNLILSTDNQFYSNFNLDTKRYLYSYVLLKPDSITYINEIFNNIKELGFKIKNAFLINNFNNEVKKFYYNKSEDYIKQIYTHLEIASKLFLNKGILLILDKNTKQETLLYETYFLKKNIRNNYGLTNARNSFVMKENNIYHLNLIHCPDPNQTYYDQDIDNILKSNFYELKTKDIELIKKYKTFEVN